MFQRVITTRILSATNYKPTRIKAKFRRLDKVYSVTVSYHTCENESPAHPQEHAARALGKVLEKELGWRITGDEIQHGGEGFGDDDFQLIVTMAYIDNGARKS